MIGGIPPASGQDPESGEWRRTFTIVTTRPNADGSPSDTRETGVNWHSDLSYTTRPAMGSLLHCLEIPEIGLKVPFEGEIKLK